MKVFVGQPLVEPSTQDLLAGHTVVTGGGNLPRSEWPLFADADALLPTPRERITADVLAAAPRVRIVASHSVGVDHVDLSACRARGILVTNTPDVLTDATADLAFALILAVARRLREGEALARSGTWDGWKPRELLGVSLAGKTLGIYGFGRIGRAVARRGEAFGMEVVSFDKEGTEEEFREVSSEGGCAVDPCAADRCDTRPVRSDGISANEGGQHPRQHRARPDRGRGGPRGGPSFEASLRRRARRVPARAEDRGGSLDSSQRRPPPAPRVGDDRRRASRWRGSRARRSSGSSRASRR